MAVVGLVGVGVVEVAVHPSVVGEPTGSLRVVAVVGHEMVETQGVGVEQILVLDFATAGVGQDLFAMGVVEHWRMAGEVVAVHVHQEEGTVQVHLEGEGVEGHHAAEGEGDPSLVLQGEATVLVLPMVVQKSC